jgi:hypothetical protein
MFQKYYFFIATGGNNRYLQWVVVDKNPSLAFSQFKKIMKREGIENFNITTFKRIK